MTDKEKLKIYQDKFGDLIQCLFCGEIHFHRNAINTEYKYKEIKCKCGRIIYC